MQPRAHEQEDLTSEMTQNRPILSSLDNNLKETNAARDESSKSAVESTDEDEQFNPNPYLQKQLQQVDNQTRKSQRKRKPVDRLGF